MLSSFWIIFTDRDKKRIRSFFFKYAKYSFGLPSWTRNYRILTKYDLCDPLMIEMRRNHRFTSSFDHKDSLFQAISQRL